MLELKGSERTAYPLAAVLGRRGWNRCRVPFLYVVLPLPPACCVNSGDVDFFHGHHRSTRVRLLPACSQNSRTHYFLIRANKKVMQGCAKAAWGHQVPAGKKPANFFVLFHKIPHARV